MAITNFDTVEADDYQVDGKSIIPITSPVTIEVGAGKEYETFHAAMVWATSQVTNNNGRIAIRLPGGTHEALANYYIYNTSISIYSEESVIITLRSTASSNKKMFTVKETGSLSFSEVTIDPAENGYAYSSTVTILTVEDSAQVALSASTLKNCATGLSISTSGKVDLLQLGADLFFTNCTTGIYLTGMNATAVIPGASGYVNISSCTTGINVYEGARCLVLDANLSGNTADYGTPLNEIQYDGSYISDGTAALTLKA